jgi:DNA-binding response OmpR family regulator
VAWDHQKEGKPPIMTPTITKPILLVDDDLDLLHLLRSGLENKGYHVLARTNVPCREEFAAMDPALVFMDINLQHENGAALCSAIKRDGHGPHPAVILISGLGEGELRVSTEASRADGWLVKPFAMHSMFALAEYYTKRAD